MCAKPNLPPHREVSSTPPWLWIGVAAAGAVLVLAAAAVAAVTYLAGYWGPRFLDGKGAFDEEQSGELVFELSGDRVLVDGKELGRLTSDTTWKPGPELVSTLKGQVSQWNARHPDAEQVSPELRVQADPEMRRLVAVAYALREAGVTSVKLRIADQDHRVQLGQVCPDPRDMNAPLDKSLHLELRGPRTMLLWKEGRAVIEIVDVTAEAANPNASSRDLGAVVTEQWNQNGAHRALTDDRFDQAVVAYHHDARYSRVAVAVQALATPKRKRMVGSETVEVPAFQVALHLPYRGGDPCAPKSRAQAIREAREFGIVGLVQPPVAGDPRPPAAPWGRDTSLGSGDVNARQNLWEDEVGAASGGAALRRTDSGLAPREFPKAKLRMGATSVSGRLAPEVIQRIVRQQSARFIQCYEQGLSQDPNLEGRVAVRFVIDREGMPSNVSNGGSDLPNSGVIRCVVEVYQELSFPPPESGIVTVVYPIVFSPK